MIELSNAFFSYGEADVLENISLKIEKGEHIAIMGKSGSGKTTLVKAIAGLLKAKSGEVLVKTEKIAYVFQEPRLLPWLSALENVMFVLAENEADTEKASELLEELELEGASEKLPSELSGGMQQRVSIARALAFGADILILDEPFSALDEKLKEKTISLIKKRAADIALIFVTHDICDARALCDKIYYIEDKHLNQGA